MCGEKQRSAESVTIPMGSPPHVRGKDRLWQKRFHEVGITPACAGKRRAQDRQDPPRGDHPRMCGEKVSSTSPIKCLKGSPPHVRGKAEKNGTFCPGVRITPACAGKRLKRSRSTVPPVAIVPLFPSVCNKPVVSDGSPAGRDAPLFLPAENAVPASPAYNLRSL